MKHTWLIWFLIVGVVVTILVALNYEGRQQTIPLSEIFSEEETRAVEYEFVEADNDLSHLVNNVVTRQQDQGQVTAAVSKTRETSQQPAPELTAMPPVRVSPQVSAKPSSPAVAVSVPVVRPGSPQAVHSGKNFFTIQVASFKDKDRAEKALTQIRQKGHASAYIGSKPREGGGFWYRIYVGEFNARQEAAELLPKIQQDYKDSFILLLQNP